MNYKQIVWNLAKPFIEGWLTSRALVIPADKKAALAAKYKIAPAQLDGLISDLEALAIAAIEGFKP